MARPISRVLALLAVLALFSSGHTIAADSEPAGDADLGFNIAQAVSFDGRLWLLGAADHGAPLVSYVLSDGTRAVHFRNGVLAFQKVGGRFFVLTIRNHIAVLREWKGGTFTRMPSPRLLSGEVFDRLISAGDQLVVRTSQSLFVLEGNSWRRLKGQVNLHSKDTANGFGFVPSLDTLGMPASKASLYLGMNRGEWGGGLIRVDLATGEHVSNEDISSPVNAIISDTGRKDCIIAAVGLIHFMASGRLVRVCGDRAEVLLEKKITSENSASDFASEAFFGLVPAAGGFWAVSNSAVYRFGLSGQPQRYVFSHFEQWHGLWINRDVEGVLVLVTETNRRFSVNNGTPLIVPLD